MSYVIYDQFGRKIESGIKPPKKEFPAVSIKDRWNSYPSSYLTPEKLARIFKEADYGDIARQFELFDEILEKDGHILAETTKRENALMRLEYSIKPFNPLDKKSVKIAEFVEETLNAIDVYEIIDILKNAATRGFAACEIVWDVSEKNALPVEIKPIEQKRFIWRYDSPYPFIVIDNKAEAIEPFKIMFHKYTPLTGSPNRAPILRVLAWMFLFKHYSIKDWVAFSEVYGMPLRLGKYDITATQEDKDALKSAISQLGSDAAGIISKNTEIEFVEAIKQATSDVYDSLIKLANTEISKAVLGQTLTADVGKVGSYAAANIHNEVRHDLLEADAKSLAKTIRKQLFAPLVGFNFGFDNPPCYIEFDTNLPKDKQKEADIATKLFKDVGIELSKSWIYSNFDIPKPKDKEDTILPQSINVKQLKSSGSGYTKDQLAVEKLVENSTKKGRKGFEGMLNPIIKIVEESESYEEIQEKIMTLFSELYTPDELNELLAQAIFAADLYGRLSGR